MMRRYILSFLLVAAMTLFVACGEKGILLMDKETASGTEGIMDSSDMSDEGEASLSSEECDSVILVHICGAVVHPGVYELAAGSRIYQLIELAGGFTEDAAEGYLNLAGGLSDGQKIVVPTLSEAADDPYGEAEITVQAGEAAGDNGLVNINTADKARLMTLPGIGEAKALAIIAWRTEHGAFRTTGEIMQVSGIKETAYEKIKTLITVD